MPEHIKSDVEGLERIMQVLLAQHAVYLKSDLL